MVVKGGYTVAINGVEYFNLASALEELNMSHLDEDYLRREAYRNNTSVVEVLEYYIATKDFEVQVPFYNRGNADAVIARVTLFNSMFATTFKTEKEVNTYIRTHVNASISEMQTLGFDGVQLIKYLIDAGLDVLLCKNSKGKLLQYNGAYYQGGQSFYVSQGVYSLTFYAELLRYKGDVVKAIEVARLCHLTDKGDYFYGKHFTTVKELQSMVHYQTLKLVTRIMVFGVTLGQASEIFVALRDFLPQIPRVELKKRSLKQRDVIALLSDAYRVGKTVRSVDELMLIIESKEQVVISK